MRKLIVVTLCSILLSSCETVKYIQNDDRLNTIGAFELNPVRQNSYWYNGRSYEYNDYRIEVTAAPGQARIQWDGKTIGTTPFIYSYTGILDKDDYIRIRAIPVNKDIPAQETMLRVKMELPRKIHFDLRNK